MIVSLANANTEQMERAVSRAFLIRVLPVLALIYMVAWLDRQNVAFAKLQMIGDLGIGEYAFGLGSSLFFLGYVLFQIPNTIALGRFGATNWFAPSVSLWGITTIGLVFCNEITMFYLLRFILGACEAGFFTGAVFVVTQWLPYGRRAETTGILLSCGLAANIIGGPLCGVMLDLDGALGLAGWQWVFVATGVPALALGLTIPWTLPAGPESAKFLTPIQKAWLANTLASERGAQARASPRAETIRGLRDPHVWLIGLPFFALGCSSMGLSYWLPTIVQSFGVSGTVNGLLNALPWMCVSLTLLWLPRHADRSDERFWHILIPALTAAIAIASLMLVESSAAKLLLICIGAAGIFGIQPILWALPSRVLSGPAMAAVLAAAGAIGNLGAFAAQNVVPWISEITGSVLAPMAFVAVMLVPAGVLGGYVARRGRPRPVNFQTLTEVAS